MSEAALEFETAVFELTLGGVGGYGVYKNGSGSLSLTNSTITSTYGEGEPPDMAKGFWDWLKSESAPKLAHLRYSVLALGDTNYADFCQFGKNCDERLAAQAERRPDRVAGDPLPAAPRILPGQRLDLDVALDRHRPHPRRHHRQSVLGAVAGHRRGPRHRVGARSPGAAVADPGRRGRRGAGVGAGGDRKSTRLNSSHRT